MAANNDDVSSHALKDWFRKAGGCCLAYVVFAVLSWIVIGVGEAVDSGHAVRAIAGSLLVAAAIAGAGWYGWWAYSLHQKERARRSAELKLDEYHLRKRAEELGESFPPEVLRRLESANVPVEEIARAALQFPEDVDYVCDTDYRQIDPYAFEEWTAKLFGLFGFATTVTQKSGDGAIDVVLLSGGAEYGVVQCKQNAFDNRVGLKDTKEFLWEAQKYQVGYIVTTSDFTKHAQAEARGTNVTLVTGADLATWVSAVRQIRDGVRAQCDPRAAAIGGE